MNRPANHKMIKNKALSLKNGKGKGSFKIDLSKKGVR